MRRLIWVSALVVVGMLPVLPAVPTAAGAASVEASFELGPPPPWQTGDGSWVGHSSPVVADLDPSRGNGPEIVVGSLDGKVYALRASNTSLQLVWTYDAGTFIDSSPAVGDLDGDGFSEVVVGAGREARPATSGLHVITWDGKRRAHHPDPGGPGLEGSVGVFSTPAIGDVSGDGRPDLVYGSFNHRIYARHADGADLAGWEGGKPMHDTVWSSPALADLDGDGDMEIVIGSDLGGGASVFGCPQPARGVVAAFQADGSFLPGWPKCMDTPIWSSPAVVDVTGDGVLDVIVGTNNYRENGVNVGQPWKVYAWDANGAELWTASLRANGRVFGSPAVGDVDGDGRAEVAITSIDDNIWGQVWLIDAQTGNVQWHHSDGADDSCCIFLGSPILADVDGDGRDDVIAAGGDGRLHAWNGSGQPVLDLGLGRTFFNAPAAADVDGDGSTELVAASAVHASDPPRGMVWTVSTSGRTDGVWPMFKRAPDRRSALGSGVLRAPLPPPPAPAATSRRSPRRASGGPATTPTLAPATPVPTEDPTPTPARPTPVVRAVSETEDGAGKAVAGGAAGSALVTAAAVLAVARRRHLI